MAQATPSQADYLALIEQYLGSLQQQPARPPANPMARVSSVADKAEKAKTLYDMASGLGGATAGAEAMSGPGAYMASIQSGMPMAEMGLYSPAEGLMAQMAAGGAPVEAPLAATPTAVPAAVALATVLGGRYGLRALQGKTKNWKDASLADNAGRATLAMATFGGSEIANKLFGGHRSTKERQAGATAQMRKMAPDDQNWQNYIEGMRGADWQKGDGSGHAYAGKYDTWDQYKKAGLEAGDLTGVAGNLKTFGPEWATLGFDKQKAITQALIDNNLYDAGGGDVNVTNRDLAKSLYSKVLGGEYQPGRMQNAVGSISPEQAQQIVQPQQPDAGTLKRWRENKGKVGFTSGMKIPGKRR